MQHHGHGRGGETDRAGSGTGGCACGGAARDQTPVEGGTLLSIVITSLFAEVRHPHSPSTSRDVTAGQGHGDLVGVPKPTLRGDVDLVLRRFRDLRRGPLHRTPQRTTRRSRSHWRCGPGACTRAAPTPRRATCGRRPAQTPPADGKLAHTRARPETGSSNEHPSHHAPHRRPTPSQARHREPVRRGAAPARGRAGAGRPRPLGPPATWPQQCLPDAWSRIRRVSKAAPTSSASPSVAPAGRFRRSASWGRDSGRRRTPESPLAACGAQTGLPPCDRHPVESLVPGSSPPLTRRN